MCFVCSAALLPTACSLLSEWYWRVISQEQPPHRKIGKFTQERYPSQQSHKSQQRNTRSIKSQGTKTAPKDPDSSTPNQ